ncbi:hypothetical protein SAMN05518672_101264 [Chitinophaga sp. CF118]|uniref:hypothetical protein n=1 Tax=Chitinophaga sp. CF118 TaxID=1884367 RepID=UPI0008EE979D|nr:hypothetical protein [Chitinophaga sp. CF118]SFD05817.1 hypothetical protein SAMN05518672_101264 [Chitinophaga sp. CF118]
MNKLVLALLAICLLGSCKSKHKKGAGDEFTFEDFRQLFTNTVLPYKLTPDSLKVVQADSLAITPELMSQFLTDTLTKSIFPADSPVQFFPLSYFEGGDMKYFVVKAIGKTATTAYLCMVDKKGHYLNSLLVAKVSSTGKSLQYFSVDNKQVIKITEEKELSPGHSSTKEEFYGVDAKGATTLIMTNSSGEAAAGQIFNPIETSPAKHKLSGDYESGELSIVSIRDGNDPKSFQFFISFSKETTGCKGELSGTGHFTSANKGEYKDKDTDCGISFQFSSGRLSIKEIGGCGAYRGVKCFFEGNFKKK